MNSAHVHTADNRFISFSSYCKSGSIKIHTLFLELQYVSISIWNFSGRGWHMSISQIHRVLQTLLCVCRLINHNHKIGYLQKVALSFDVESVNLKCSIKITQRSCLVCFIWIVAFYLKCVWISILQGFEWVEFLQVNANKWQQTFLEADQGPAKYSLWTQCYININSFGFCTSGSITVSKNCQYLLRFPSVSLYRPYPTNQRPQRTWSFSK